MLIKCPECGKDVSDKAPACIHCGCPLESMNPNMCEINGKIYNLSKLLEIVQEDEPYVGWNSSRCLRFLFDTCNLGFEDAKRLYYDVKESLAIPTSFTPTGRPYNTPANATLKCPKCGSTAITTGARGINGFWGPIGASKTVNRCGNCSYTWTPRG